MPAAPRVQLRVTRAGRLWILAAVGLGLTGLTKNINLILLLGYFLGGLFVLNWVAARRSLLGVSGVTDLPPATFAGEWVRWAVLVGPAGRSTSGLWVRTQAAGAAVEWPSFAGGNGPIKLARPVRLGSRGRFTAGPVTLGTSFPFGLVEASVSWPDAREYVVYPRRGQVSIDRVLPRILDVARLGQRRVAVRHLTDGTDIHGLRQFRTGDSPRWIHWKTTARVGTLMVREFDRAAGPSAAVVVEPAGMTDADQEAALSFVATLVAEWGQSQDGRLTLLIPEAGTWQRLELTHRRQAVEILARLAAWPRNGLVMERFTAESVPPLPDNRATIVVGRGRAQRLSGTNRTLAVRVDPTVQSEWYTPPTTHA
jgi:uncharacterized protein (DUF58 family)